MLEKLYRLKWGRLDGLGALIISPTRELALQIFDELRKIGARHSLSAGLLIGGKNVRVERERVNGAVTYIPYFFSTVHWSEHGLERWSVFCCPAR